MSNTEMQAGFNKKWDKAIQDVRPHTEETLEWHSAHEIQTVLAGFMGENSNHAHLPDSGGMDFLSVSGSHVEGFLEFGFGERKFYWLKPLKLTLERLNSNGNSFLLLELSKIGKIAEDGLISIIETSDQSCGSQALLELSPGEYVDWDCWNQGFLGHDEYGNEIPIPDSARLITRAFSGKILFVSKGSFWNIIPATYDGRHSKMTSLQIRETIEKYAK
jgi:hypothetical protein